MAELQSPQWMIDRGFESPCRVCGCWSVQNHHWISDHPLSNKISEYSQGHYEKCVPLDNLEYLEWCYERKLPL